MSNQIPTHFDLPFRFSGNHVATVEQDTLDDVVNCVQVILLTYVGSRVEAPAFGSPDLAFKNQPLGRDFLIELITSQEPRAIVAIQEHPDVFNELIDRVLLEVQTNGGQT